MASSGFVQLRRGIREHLRVMTPHELMVYVGLLVEANPASGRVSTTVSDLVDLTDMSAKVIQSALRRLQAMKYITYKPTNNRWQPSEIRICKWKNTAVVDTAVRPPVRGSVRGSVHPPVQPSSILDLDKDLDTLKKKDIAHDDAFKEVLSRWPQKKTDESLAASRYRKFIVGKQCQDKFTLAVGHYLASEQMPYVMKLDKFIGVPQGDQPWMKYVLGDPNNQKTPTMLTLDGKCTPESEVRKLAEEGKAKHIGSGEWVSK